MPWYWANVATYSAVSGALPSSTRIREQAKVELRTTESRPADVLEGIMDADDDVDETSDNSPSPATLANRLRSTFGQSAKSVNRRATLMAAILPRILDAALESARPGPWRTTVLAKRIPRLQTRRRWLPWQENRHGLGNSVDDQPPQAIVNGRELASSLEDLNIQSVNALPSIDNLMSQLECVEFLFEDLRDHGPKQVILRERLNRSRMRCRRFWGTR